MSEELPYILHWHNGKEPFKIIEQNISDIKKCNFCWASQKCLSISKMLSSEIWSLKYDTYMCICYNCISQYTTVNIKYVIYRNIKDILGNNISNIINEYL